MNSEMNIESICVSLVEKISREGKPPNDFSRRKQIIIDGLTISEGGHGFLYVSDDKLSIQFYSANRRTEWELYKTHVKIPGRKDIDVTKHEGPWNTYRQRVLEKINRELYGQLSKAEYESIERQKALAAAAAAFPAKYRQPIPEPALASENNPPVTDTTSEDILAQRDFLARQLNVTDLPEPTPKSHKGAWKKMLRKS